MELGVATLETNLEGALALGPQALALAEGGRTVLLSASFEEQALVLGALQLETTLCGRSSARFDQRITRRASTGTEAQCSGPMLYHALALPRVDALFSDASARTLLNRNLRAFLRGYIAAGVPLRYFGTEVLALLGHPVALVGYDVSASGAVLIEVMLGLEHPCVVRPALKREPPAALYPLLRRSPPAGELLGQVVSGLAARLDATCVDVTGQLASSAPTLPIEPTEVQVSVAIPLGVVEAVPGPPLRIFGDLLVSRAALARVEAAARAVREAGGRPGADVLVPLQGAPLDGARPTDILAALDLLPD